MAKKENKMNKALLSDKSRVLVLILAFIVLLAGVIFALWGLKKRSEEQTHSGAQLRSSPYIESVPGVEKESPEYVKIQREENRLKVEEAARAETSAVPTLTRASYIGEPTDLIGNKPRPGCSQEELKRAKAAGVKAEELRCKGCTTKDLRAGGYAAPELRAATADAKDLLTAGYRPDELREAGFSAGELKGAGLGAGDLKAVAFTAIDLKKAGFNPTDLRHAGFSSDELKAAGFSVKDLKNGGFSPFGMVNAGYTPADLKDAGYSAAQLNDLGFPPDQLLKAGFTDKDLQNVGILPNQIAAAKVKAKTKSGPEMPKECNVAALTRARSQGITAAQLKDKLGCSAAALKAAGYTAAELKAAGFSAKDLKDAGFSAKELKDAGFTAAELKAAGFSAKDLKDAGFSAKELRAAGFTAAELKAAGFSAKDLKEAGFSDGDLLRAGFSPDEINPPPPPTPAPAATVTLPNPAPAEAATVTFPSVGGNQNQAKTLETLQKRQAAQLSAQQQQDLLQQMQSQMTAQVNDLIGSWSPPPKQQFVVHTEEKTEKGGASAKGTKESHSSSSVTGGKQQGEQGTNLGNVKAGTVFFGVIDTGINSDEKSPILATIVYGPLKGSKLLGQFDRVDKKVVLTFTTISVPGLPASAAITAVAIDADTARTALASEVDSHYLLRYGTLFASSFLTGLSQAIQDSGATTVSQPLGSTTTTNPTTTGSQKLMIALGQVGTQYAQEMKQNFKVPPTVTVEAGTGIGVLFMADANGILPTDILPPS